MGNVARQPAQIKRYFRVGVQNGRLHRDGTMSASLHFIEPEPKCIEPHTVKELLPVGELDIPGNHFRWLRIF